MLHSSKYGSLFHGYFNGSWLQTTPPPSRPIQQPPLSTKEQVLRETGEFTCEIVVWKVHISLFSLIQLFIGEEFVKCYMEVKITIMV